MKAAWLASFISMERLRSHPHTECGEVQLQLIVDGEARLSFEPPILGADVKLQRLTRVGRQLHLLLLGMWQGMGRGMGWGRSGTG